MVNWLDVPTYFEGFVLVYWLLSTFSASKADPELPFVPIVVSLGLLLRGPKVTGAFAAFFWVAGSPRRLMVHKTLLIGVRVAAITGLIQWSAAFLFSWGYGIYGTLIWMIIHSTTEFFWRTLCVYDGINQARLLEDSLANLMVQLFDTGFVRVTFCAPCGFVQVAYADGDQPPMETRIKNILDAWRTSWARRRDYPLQCEIVPIVCATRNKMTGDFMLLSRLLNCTKGIERGRFGVFGPNIKVFNVRSKVDIAAAIVSLVRYEDEHL